MVCNRFGSEVEYISDQDIRHKPKKNQLQTHKTMDTNNEPANPPTKEPGTTPKSITKPRKLIISNGHLQAFIDSVTHAEVVDFIESLNQSIIGLPLDHPLPLSDNIDRLLEILENIKNIALAHPPVDNKASRFGNPAFREFYDQLDQGSEALHSSLAIPEDKRVELSTYLTESWGNRSRIDYGSGMELNFLCWLLCLKKLKVFGSEDYPAVVLKVFWKYIEVMRYLQSTYWLEPAGSHGVWGLDDYHFLPFLFGAGQLRNHKYLKPKSIHDPDVLEGFSHQYMYLACIQFINSIKTASLRWHSPMLDDISGVKTWDKVNSGMIKMYKAEVLAKLPVAQHFLFGTLLPFPDGHIQEVESKTDGSLVVDHAGHLHVKGQQGWGECCGIPIPSSFAAATAENKNPAIRRIPFD
ncbi:Serine/threonine-protein phosphatase 2A activator 2 [Puccinia graminis f. sp. tritici]|uniref:Serine/threonine-protein phosphatase 2A activator n=2 Tax=Puccinia graminis f. sp. tritici TaxID=56615 RepID=E3KZB5_PUCGT|nr:peptidylprolyl isomerase [Puccinia graminis f. sp. tritici CRL 75-36-700-3]EFP89640.2 peptidylprolyl isomerase [Puccinia graminis f. sp. tritici CRL 75-36-700-3]KAA1108835.1 Serine/threonine-protein phosphatase 2A activator 2 [Puccinia graminis f. sp. tritici]